MNDLLVRTDRGEVAATFRLSPFITDWETGRKSFVSCIADDFGDLLSPRPHDFSSAVPADLGEAWCKYRIFGGSEHGNPPTGLSPTDLSKRGRS